MTQEIISRRIKDALSLTTSSGDPTAVLDCLDSLFIDLIQDDMLFYILKEGSSFHSPSLSSKDSRQFLHVFTEPKIAKEKVEKEELEVVRVSSLELLQIAKCSFLQDAYGIFLNKQAAISIKRLLIAFNKRVLKEESAISDSYLNCYSLISAIRKNQTNMFVCIEDNGIPAMEVDDVTKTYIMNNGEYDLPNQTAVIRPINLQTLFHMVTPIEVTTSELSMVIDSKADLLNMLEILGIYKEFETYQPASGFQSEPAALPKSTKYKSITSLSLAFDRDEDDLISEEELPIETEAIKNDVDIIVPKKEDFVIKMSEVAEGDSSDTPDDTVKKVRTFAAITAGTSAFMAKIFTKKTEEDEPEITNEIVGSKHNVTTDSMDTAEPPDNPSEVKNEEEVPESPTEETPKNDSQDGKSEKKPMPLLKISSKTIGILSIFIVLAFLMMLRPVIFKSRNDTNAYKEVLANRDYSSASELYQSQYDNLILDDVQNAVNNYARDEESAESVAAHLIGLDLIPEQEQVVKDAFETARELEASKNAYILGDHATILKDKLSYWTAVIPMDVNNYDLVRECVESNPWDEELVRLIEESAELNWDESKEYAALAYFYYPDNNDIAKWKYYHDTNESAPPLSVIPVTITGLSVVSGSNNSISLYIEWENTGFKTIEQVSFLFSFYDKNGDIVYYGDNTIFRGVEKDGGPYEPGYKSKNQTPYPWGWTNLWSGLANSITRVSLEQVIVKYQNGELQAITNDVDLANVLK